MTNFFILSIFIICSADAVFAKSQTPISSQTIEAREVKIPEQAKESALKYATDKVFMDILDHSSSVVITSFYEDQTQYIFNITAEECGVEVFVNKATGIASHKKEMTCPADTGSQIQIVQDRVTVYGAELVGVEELIPTDKVSSGSKKFLVSINYCGYDQVTTPQFQSVTIDSHNNTYLNNFMAIYIQKSMVLSVEHKYDPEHANTSPCWNVKQTYEFTCPIRPGFEAAACEISINNSFTMYLANFKDGKYLMQKLDK